MRVLLGGVGPALSGAELDGGGRLAGGEAGAVAHAKNMGIDGDRLFAEGDVEDDVRGLASDPGQRLERLAVVRHLAAVQLDQDAPELHDVPPLRPLKPNPLYVPPA